MYTFKRELSVKLKQRLVEPPKNIQIIGGPRQTGKTVLVQQACNSLYDNNGIGIHFCAVDKPPLPEKFDPATVGGGAALSPPDKPDTDWLVFHWEKARREAISNKIGYVLVFDEIQKIKQWSEAVKGLWDDDRRNNTNLHVILLGSAPLLIQQGLSESLAGRYEYLVSKHWSFTEMNEAFNFTLDEYIYFGGYPGGASLIRDQERWLDYIRHGLIEPNIEKDILMMTRIDKPILLKNVFEIACEYSGQIVAYTKMLGQLDDAGNSTTLAHYMDLLSKAGLIAGLSIYSGSKIRRRASKPKLNVLNTALMSCLSGYSFEQAMADRTFWGRLVESTVGAHLINSAPSGSKVFYWRKGNDEVDFIFQHGRQLLAIEVKSDKNTKNFTGFEKFSNEYGKTKTLLIGAGGNVSLQDFLSSPIMNQLIDG